MSSLFHRELHLSRLRSFLRHDDPIKVIMGIRRCGKSPPMLTAAEELREPGIPSNRILFLDLDARKHRRTHGRRSQTTYRITYARNAGDNLPLHRRSAECRRHRRSPHWHQGNRKENTRPSLKFATAGRDTLRPPITYCNAATAYAMPISLPS